MDRRTLKNGALLSAIAALILIMTLAAGSQAAGIVVKLTDRLGTSQTVDLLSMPQLDYKASYKRSSGAVVGPFSYSGPSLLSVLAVVAQRSEKVKRYIEDTGLPFDVLIDDSRETVKAYGVWHRVGLDAWNIARPALRPAPRRLQPGRPRKAGPAAGPALGGRQRVRGTFGLHLR